MEAQGALHKSDLGVNLDFRTNITEAYSLNINGIAVVLYRCSVASLCDFRYKYLSYGGLRWCAQCTVCPLWFLPPLHLVSLSSSGPCAVTKE